MCLCITKFNLLSGQTTVHTMNHTIDVDESNPCKLIPKLCSHFYQLGWASGTGGGMSIRKSDKIFIAPSGVQKEMIKEDDMFVIDINGNSLNEPLPSRKLKRSECTPLFLNAYRLRNAGAVLHAHSMNAVLVTLITPGNEFRISHQEMIKGIKKGSSTESHRYNETLVVPIIENTCYESDLTRSMGEAMMKYQDTNAILVRRHGVYVWGDSWKSAKTMAECYDYLFKLAVEMKKLDLPLEYYGGDQVI